MKKALSNLHPALLMLPLALLLFVASLVQPVRSQATPPFWEANGDHIYNTNLGNVGIGIMNPMGTLDVRRGGYGTQERNIWLPTNNSSLNKSDLWQSFTPTISGRLVKFAVNKLTSGATALGFAQGTESALTRVSPSWTLSIRDSPLSNMGIASR